MDELYYLIFMPTGIIYFRAGSIEYNPANVLGLQVA